MVIPYLLDLVKVGPWRWTFVHIEATAPAPPRLATFRAVIAPRRESMCQVYGKVPQYPPSIQHFVSFLLLFRFCASGPALKVQVHNITHMDAGKSKWTPKSPTFLVVQKLGIVLQT